MRRKIVGLVIAVIGLLVPLSIAIANPRSGANPGEHIVEPGDSLWQIAVSNNVTLEALLAANPDLNPYALSIGAVVRIPNTAALRKDPLEREAGRNEYQIQAGDDLWGIALRFDVSFEDLLAANPSVDPYTLTVGQMVTIPGVLVSAEATATPIPSGTSEYIVQPDDNLWLISQATDVSIETLLALNEGIDPYQLTVGQVLLLPEENGAATTADTNTAANEDGQITPLREGSGTQAIADEIAASLGQFLRDADEQLTTLLPLMEVEGQIILPPVEEVGIEVETAADLEETTVEAEAITAPVIDAANLTSNIVPITINVPEGYPVENATLAINGFELAFFTQPPFTFELDMTTLSAGAYNLTFTQTTTANATSSSTLPFEIAYASAVNTNVDDPKLNGTGIRLTEQEVSRRLLLNGAEQTTLNLAFSPETGLTPIIEAAPVAATNESIDVMSILSRPISLIPEPVREILLAPRPREAAIIILVMTVTLLPQGIFTLYWMMYTWNNPATAEKYRSPKAFAQPQHSFTAILPARQEEDVIRQTIMAVNNINYPDELKEVLVMVRDEDDDATIEAVRQTIAELGKDNIHLITFTDGPRNKPNGLNKGLRAATKEVICVFDAEDEPHADIYNVVNTVMLRDSADVVQSGVQLMNFRSSWFSAFNCLEYFFWFKSGLHCFTHAFRVTPLGGNTVFFKKFWLDRIGGWDLNCLTEDADVGIRLTQAGAKIQIVYDEQHATQEETPATVDSFIKQRTRWCQGFYQVFFKGDWIRLPEMRQRITAIYILLNSLMQAATILYLPVGIFIALTQQIAVPVALLSYFPIFILILQMITNLIGIREFCAAYNLKMPFLFTFKMIIAYYPYQLMMAAASFRAVFRFIGQQQTWEKTSHANLHRQTTVAR